MLNAKQTSTNQPISPNKLIQANHSHQSPPFPPDTLWDVEGTKASGLYTWFKEISEELDNNWVIVDDKKMLMLGGYSYLGLNKNLALADIATQSIKNYGTGMSGSRFLAGSTLIHQQLENEIAQLHQKQDAMLLTSGYLANVSTITALMKKGDFIITDKQNHASIMDGARYSNATILRYKHKSIKHCETILKKAPTSDRKLLITDSIFSMCGEPANIPEIVYLCKKYGAQLMVDECHSMFTLGTTGGGIVEYFNLNPNDIDIIMATLSKAIPASGGYITASKKIIEFLRHESRGFIYSVALPSLMSSIALKGLQIFNEQRANLVGKLNENTRFFSEQLRAYGIDIGQSVTSIIPILIGDSHKAAVVAKKCQQQGIFIHAVYAPVVPVGKAILRASITASHQKSDLLMAARKISMIINQL